MDVNLSTSYQDSYDVAFRWGWNVPHLRQLVYFCYKTPDLADNARRFYESEEFREAVRILTELGKQPGKQVCILDFGCGNGIASYSLARIGYSVVGIDSSLGELAGLNAAKKIQQLDGIQFDLHYSRGEELKFPDNSFDIVWVREALHHITNLSGFLKEVTRILKEDGILCCLREVVIWNESQRQHFFSTHPFHHITKDEGCYYLDEYLTAFKEAGLIVEETLEPHSSIINTYPSSARPNVVFEETRARKRMQGYDLFSFFVRKPSKPTSHMQNAINLLSLGKAAEALETFNMLTGQRSHDENVLYGKAIALTRLGRIEEAIVLLEELIARAPNHEKAQLLLHQLKATQPALKQSTSSVLFQADAGFYSPVQLNPSTLANMATSPEIWNELLSFHHLLASDKYVAYLDAYYREGFRKFGKHWWYLDIVNILFAASKALQPKNYLEIGVRRGRSLCTVVRGCPSVNIFGFDMWVDNYAGMENPGPDFVRSELEKHGHTGALMLVSGDSHQTIPRFFAERTDLKLDIITVDGDHSENGAFADLCNVVPRLSVGGVVVFDDIAHPEHPYLLDVWRRIIHQFPFLSGFEFTESGYGVAFAIRMRA